MRVYVSADMEGTAGVSGWAETHPGDRAYPRAQALMAGEVNAALAGAFAGGATEIGINDSHNGMRNLSLVELPEGVQLLNGSPKRYSMVEGAEPAPVFQGEGSTKRNRWDVALFTGYHAAAGRSGNLAHTFTLHLREVRLNGDLVSETFWNAHLLGQWGIPVGLVTGDDVLEEDVRRLIPDAVYVRVKEAVEHTAALSLPVSEVRARIQDGAREAVQRAARGALSLLRIVGPYELEVEFDAPTRAERASLCPRAELGVGDRVRYEATTLDEAFFAFRTIISLGTAD